MSLNHHVKMAACNVELEERLREMCCIGDEKNVKVLVERGVNLNATNSINWWTPLHWAAKRGHRNIVRYLLQQCADTRALTRKGETAGQLSTDEEIRKMLGEEETINLDSEAENLPIVPNYLRNPEFFYAQKTSENSHIGKLGCEKEGVDLTNRDCSILCALDRNENKNSTSCIGHKQSPEEIVLKLRISNLEDKDFVEVDLNKSSLTYENLVSICCHEFDVEADDIKRVRKLPNTIVRNDKDVKRLLPFQELEVVLKREKNIRK